MNESNQGAIPSPAERIGAATWVFVLVALVFVSLLLWLITGRQIGRGSGVPGRTLEKGLYLPSDASDRIRKTKAWMNRWGHARPPAADDLASQGWTILQESAGTQYRKIYVGGELRNGFDVRSPGEVVLARVIPRNHDLVFSVALHDRWGKEGGRGGAVFDVLVRSKDGVEKAVHTRALDGRKGGRAWLDVRLPVDSLDGEEAEIHFRFTPQQEGRAGNGCFVSVPIVSPRERDSSKTNVIVYLVDALRADHLGCYGYGRATSPQIDAFAGDSVLFEKASSTSSWTMPGVSSIFTGLEPDAHRVIQFSSALEDKFTTMAELLQKNGWTTWQVVANPYPFMPETNLAQGFDGGLYLDWGEPVPLTTAADLNGSIFPWLEDRKSEPFFLYVHTMDVHSPYRPPAEYAEMFDPDYTGSITGDIPYFPDSYGADWTKLPERDLEHVKALYDASIRFNDTEFGRLLDKLKELDLYDDTMVVFVADHGEALWDHPADADIAVGWGHGMTLYEEVLHIPLIVKFPGSKYGGVRVESPVSQIDLLPSIADVVGATAPDNLPGVNLADVAAGRETWNSRKLFHYLDNQTSSDEAGFLHRMYAVRYGKYKYILRVSPRVEEMLFDLDADRGETTNLVQANPQIAAGFRREVEERYLPMGFYLRLVVPTYGMVLAEGVLYTDGEFYDVRGLTVENDDMVKISENGRRMSFALSEEYWEDTIFFRVSPPDARIFIASTVTGARRSGRLRLGSWELDAGPLALELSANAPELAGFVERFPSLLYALEAGLYLYRLGGETAAVKREESSDVQSLEAIVPLDEVNEKIQQFRALGYL